MSKKINYQAYRTIIMQKHKETLVLDMKDEIYRLKKRIKQLEQELEGLGVVNFDLSKEEYK